MAFNGSGTFNRLYSWVQDAANGINIDATRSDNELNGMATGLSNCVTRDGQSPFSADIPAGGFKITGLAPGVAGTDAANLNNVAAVAGNEWTLEANAVAWVAITQFSVSAVDVSAIYHVGRRLRIVHNTGGTTVYATVTAVAFVTDTTVTVATDDGSSLISTVTAVSYGLISFVNPSYLDPRTAILAINTDTLGGTSSTPALVAVSELFDRTGEFGGSKFTALHPGIYCCSGQVRCLPDTADGTATIYLYKNGAEYARAENAALLNKGVVTSHIVLPILLAAGDFIQLYFSLSGGNSGVMEGHATLPRTFLGITRRA